MANENMIKFLRGNVANLPQTATEGALYFTKDEGIYLGLADGSYHRYGEFIVVADVNSLPASGAHETCMYYCAKENILAKYDSAKSGWTQINKQPTAEELKTLLGLGDMAYKSEVAEDDLNAELLAKVNASAEGNHSHSNKDVLDGITAEKVTAWDAAEQNAKDYADGLDEAMNTRVEALEAIDHEHANKAELDLIATGDKAKWDTAAGKAHEHTFVESELNKIADGDVAKWNAVVADHLDSEDDTALRNLIKEAKQAGTDANTNIETYKVSNDARVKAVEDDIAEITDGTNGILAQAKSYTDGKDSAMNTRVAALETAAPTHALKTEVEAVNAKFANYNTTVAQKAIDDAQDAEIAKKVTAVEGKDLIATSEIERLATLSNYDDTQVKADIAKKADAETMTTELGKKVDKVEGYSLVADTEIARLANVDNYDDTGVKADIAKKADSAAVTTALDGKVDKVEGFSLVDDDEIARLADVDNYDDTEVRGLIGGNTDAIDALEEYVGTIPEDATATDIVGYIQEKTSGIASEGAMTELSNRVKVIEDDYLVEADIADFETKENVKKVADDLAGYKTSNDAALAEVRGIADAARTEDEVNSQIDTKIAALNLGTTYEPIGAEDRAKAYVDGKFTDANLGQYTTEQEVKDIVDGVIAGAADSETYNSLTKLVDYIDAHGGEATEMAQAIDTLEGKVETIEGKPAYGITATQISNWDGEVGAKALAETKLDESTFTTYETAHANDYTNNQIDDAIDADVKAAIEAEVERADGKYEEKGVAQGIVDALKLAETYEPIGAEERAIADAATKYETKGTAQSIIDGLKLAETYEPIGAEERAIAAAKTETETQVQALAETLYTKDEVEALISQAHTWGEF